MHTSNDLAVYAVLLGVPTIVCGAIGALHGWRGTRLRNFYFGAFAASFITCWSVVAGGEGDVPGAAILPSWIIWPFGPFASPHEGMLPPWWLSPWLPFLTYVIAARYALSVRERRARVQQ
jgi:hypothetical protein